MIFNRGMTHAKVGFLYLEKKIYNNSVTMRILYIERRKLLTFIASNNKI